MLKSRSSDSLVEVSSKKKVLFVALRWASVQALLAIRLIRTEGYDQELQSKGYELWASIRSLQSGGCDQKAKNRRLQTEGYDWKAKNRRLFV